MYITSWWSSELTLKARVLGAYFKGVYVKGFQFWTRCYEKTAMILFGCSEIIKVKSHLEFPPNCFMKQTKPKV